MDPINNIYEQKLTCVYHGLLQHMWLKVINTTCFGAWKLLIKINQNIDTSS